ncbi:MAG: hypothetical protein ACK4U0_03810 [Mesorhizobium sp.]
MTGSVVAASKDSEINSIDFLLSGELHDVIFNPAREEGLHFHPTGTSTSLKLRLKEPEHDSFGHRKGIECVVTDSLKVKPEQVDFARAFIARKYILLPDAPIKLLYHSQGIEQIDECGNIRKGYGLPFHNLPIEIQKICDEVYDKLISFAVRFLHLIRWSQNIDAPHKLFDHLPSLYWRVEPGSYYIVPSKSNELDGRSPVGIQWDDTDRDILYALFSKDAVEPLGHELLREAISLISSSPRTALLGLSLALEAGVKQHLSRKVPQAAWLLEKMPSPPIDKIVRTYLRELHNFATSPQLNWDALKPLFKTCKELSEDRNIVAHQGCMPERANLFVYATAVSDLLYIIDFLDGEIWATDHVEQNRSALGWHSPRRSKIYFSIKSID